ncbi:MAG TPA: cytochrome c peroxidase [Planctomycetota bacterium]
MVEALGLTGDPSTGRVLPAITDPLPLLGRRLFFTKGLGGQMDAACVTCHHPMLGGGDGLSLAIGVDAVDEDLLGPNRLHDPTGVNHDGGPTVPRNSPTTFNLGMWDSGVFWDSRVESLTKAPGANGAGNIDTPDSPGFGTVDLNAGANLAAAQARFPITSGEEMRAFVFEQGNSNDVIRDHLAARVGNYGVGAGEIAENWLPLFQTGFSDPGGTAMSLITYSNIAHAIGEYERSQVFVNSPWKAFVQGNNAAISPAAKRGALLFFRPRQRGGFNCASCHSGDFFTDKQHYPLAIPQLGRGKGKAGTNSLSSQDHGRMAVSGDPADDFAQRVPSLLNLAATGPYGHSGAYTTLDGMVRHHLNAQMAWANYDYSQLAPGVQTGDTWPNTQEQLSHLITFRSGGGTTIEDYVFTDAQVADVVAFLLSLTDPAVLSPAALEPWVQRQDGFDSLLLEAHDGVNPL